MENDILEKFGDYCEFGEDRVYVLLAIARSKENSEYSSNTEPTMREIVEDEKGLEKKMEKLDHAAKSSDSDFRLYLSANSRNCMKAFFQLRSEMDEWLQMRMNGNEGVKKKFKHLDSEFKSVLQKNECKDESNFIFDLDEISKEDMEILKKDIEEFSDVRLVQETPNGFHVVTRPFNYNELDSEVDYELKKDGMIFVKYIG